MLALKLPSSGSSISEHVARPGSLPFGSLAGEVQAGPAGPPALRPSASPTPPPLLTPAPKALPSEPRQGGVMAPVPVQMKPARPMVPAGHLTRMVPAATATPEGPPTPAAPLPAAPLPAAPPIPEAPEAVPAVPAVPAVAAAAAVKAGRPLVPEKDIIVIDSD